MMRDRCVAHDLAVGPDRKCVLCRRSSVPPVAPTSATVVFISPATVVVVLATIGSLAGAAHLWRRTTAIEPRVLVESAAPDAEGVDEEEEADFQARPPDPFAHAAPLEPQPFGDPMPSPAPGESELRSSPAQKPSLEVKAKPTALELEYRAMRLREARRRVPIVMYSTTWCGVCTRARDYMREQGIAFEERDVEASPTAKELHRKLSPKGGVPTIDVDGTVLRGFGASSLERAIDEAARRRMGS